MNQKVLFAIALLLGIFVPRSVLAYDFSEVCSTGQTLYYNIVNGNAVQVTCPGDPLTSPYGGYTKPTGDLIIPYTVTYNGVTYPVTSVGEGAFCACYYLTSVEIPNSVISVGKTAFCNCSRLANVSFPVALASIGNDAFSYCYALSNITLPSTLLSIGNYAFLACRSISTVDIPNSVLTIGNNAFRYCSGLTSVTIGNSVTSIGEYAFAECGGLTSITIPSSVRSVGNNACGGVVSVQYEGSLTGCPWGGRVCNGFVEDSLIFSDETKTNLVGYVPGLTHAIIPNTVTRIESGIFQNCATLTSVTIPNSVTYIGQSAFASCTGLSSVEIPSAVSSIMDMAFYGCNLTQLILNPTTPPTLGFLAFSSSAMVVEIPCGTLADYQAAWGTEYNYHEGCAEEITIAETACEEYTWDLNGETYHQSGDYQFVYYDDAGVQITAVLQLTIGHKQHSYTEVTNCGPYTWELTGQTYNKSGMKFRKDTTPEGCPIRDTLMLTIIDRYHSYTEVENCGPYTWDKTGQTYNKSGLKFYKGTADDGCPIRDTLKLTVTDRIHSYTEVTSCGPYTWNLTGQTYNKSGMKFNKGTAPNGCLIRDTLVLTVVDRYHSYTEVTNCGSYTWDVTGQTYNKSGLKFNKGVTSDGCLIRDTLKLTVVDRWSSHDTVVSCDGTYTWDKTGQTYKKTGLKFFKGTANDGCPIRDTLYVIISQKEHSYAEVTSYGPYTWDLTGKTYNKSGLKFYKGTNEYGCPIRDTLNLTVLPASAAPESYEYQIVENEEGTEFPDPILNSQFSTLNTIKVFPNPTTGVVYLARGTGSAPEGILNSKIEVLDLVGRRVALFENTNTLDLSGLVNGTYTLRVTMPDGVTLRKVVKK